MSADACEVEVRRGDTWHLRHEPCGKRAKGSLLDGTKACGIHLRTEANAQQRSEARAEFERRKDAVNAALGVKCWGFEVGETVSISLTDLELLASSSHKTGSETDA